MTKDAHGVSSKKPSRMTVDIKSTIRFSMQRITGFPKAGIEFIVLVSDKRLTLNILHL